MPGTSPGALARCTPQLPLATLASAIGLAGFIAVCPKQECEIGRVVLSRSCPAERMLVELLFEDLDMFVIFLRSQSSLQRQQGLR